MEKPVTSIAIAVALALCASGAQADVRVCLDATRHGTAYGYPNYAYAGRVQGQAAGPAFGYGIVAIDDGGAFWLQAGGQVRASSPSINAPVLFGVSNVSTYPLSFIVVRLPSEVAYKNFRIRAHDRRALSEQEKADLPRVSQEDCKVHLNAQEEPVVGSCTCRGG